MSPFGLPVVRLMQLSRNLWVTTPYLDELASRRSYPDPAVTRYCAAQVSNRRFSSEPQQTRHYFCTRCPQAGMGLKKHTGGSRNTATIERARWRITPWRKSVNRRTKSRRKPAGISIPCRPLAVINSLRSSTRSSVTNGRSLSRIGAQASQELPERIFV